ncbi:TIGR04255 family protein [Sinosporangium album]|uniref:TIGR04255 family protein n=1 Tax=Sinosporangium album TaxID=504805 RepID=A0A1G8BK99_9ACTN|nr:TIGR04255 family protein [Sinosporangium album]SDH33591.1 TIGR04255 family protein [Sinosporangium album]
MTLLRPASPFGTEPVEEIDLRRAPLDRVLAQVRFPSLTKLQGSDAISPFAQRVTADFPFFEELRQTVFQFTPSGVATEPTDQRVWLLRSIDERWTVTVTASTVSLETTAYRSRTEFAERFGNVIGAFAEIMNPPRVERLGIRYINRLAGQYWLAELPKLVQPEVLGGLAVPLEGSSTLRVSLTETVFQNDARGIQAKWGVLPKDTFVDPSLPPIADVSWILDLDSFSQRQREFDVDELSDELRDLAAQAYRMFRWAVKDEFIERFRDDS